MKRWIFVEGPEKYELEAIWAAVDIGIWEDFSLYLTESNISLSC